MKCKRREADEFRDPATELSSNIAPIPLTLVDNKKRFTKEFRATILQTELFYKS